MPVILGVRSQKKAGELQIQGHPQPHSWRSPWVSFTMMRLAPQTNLQTNNKINILSLEPVFFNRSLGDSPQEDLGTKLLCYGIFWHRWRPSKAQERFAVNNAGLRGFTRGSWPGLKVLGLVCVCVEVLKLAIPSFFYTILCWFCVQRTTFPPRILETFFFFVFISSSSSDRVT